MIEVSLNGIDKLVKDLQGVPDKLIKPTILRMSQIAYDETQRGAGRHSKTGALFQSVYNRKVQDGRAVGHDTGRAPHAKFVLFGTRPHVIRPKTKKALRWAGPGGFVFAKRVNHPGSKADPYLETARDKALAGFERIVSEQLRDAI